MEAKVKWDVFRITDLCQWANLLLQRGVDMHSDKARSNSRSGYQKQAGGRCTHGNACSCG